MRIRDLLVHPSGLALGAGDLMLFPDSTLPAHDIMERLRYVPLSTSFRSRYAYDNVLYIVAGERVHSRIVSSDRSMVPATEDIASPHAPADGKPASG